MSCKSRLSSGGTGRCGRPASPEPSPGPGASSHRARQAIGAARAREGFVSTSVRTISSRKKGSLGALDQEPLERHQAADRSRGAPPAAPRRSRAGARRYGSGGSTSCPPAVLVLGPVVDEQEEARRSQALDEASSRAWVSASIQWRSSNRIEAAAAPGSPARASRLHARPACGGRRCGGSSHSQEASSTGTSSSAEQRRQRSARGRRSSARQLAGRPSRESCGGSSRSRSGSTRGGAR